MCVVIVTNFVPCNLVDFVQVFQSDLSGASICSQVFLLFLSYVNLNNGFEHVV